MKGKKPPLFAVAGSRHARRRGEAYGPVRAVFCALLVASTGGLTGLATAQTAPAGAIRGDVYDADFEVPLGSVRVSVIEALLTATTGPDGRFLVEGVPPGTYTLSFAKQGFEREILTDVTVSGIELTDVGRVDLGSEIYDLPELVVTASDFQAGGEVAALEIRADSVTQQDTLSAELIGKAGVSDAAGALKLVVGASVAEGKYATVRGLSDRYTGTTLNGIRVPSADPRKRAVQIDFFPTGTIENITVTKTFTPNLQGEFTGGGVDIQTKSIPDGRVLSFSISTEWDSQATNNSDFLSYRGGGLNFFGIDDGRKLPGIADFDVPPVPPPNNPTTYYPEYRPGTSQRINPDVEDDIAVARFYSDLTRSFEPAMGVRKNKAGPGYGFELVSGNLWEGPAGRLGVIGAFTYDRDSDYYEDGQNNSAGRAVSSGPFLTISRSDTRGREEILIGGLANVVYQPNDNNEISFKAIVNQAAEDDARLQMKAPPNQEQSQTLRYTERTLLSGQFHGSHRLPGLHIGIAETPGEVRWRTSYNYTEQNEPDIRQFRTGIDSNGTAAWRQGVPTQNWTRRIFRNGQERNGQLGVDVTVPFLNWAGAETQLQFGGLIDDTRRAFEQESFFYRFETSLPADPSDEEALTNRSFGPGQFNPADDCVEPGTCSDLELWTDVFSDPRRLGMHPTNWSPHQNAWILLPLENDVPYKGEQTIEALYGMLDIPLSAKVDILAGSRFEKTDMSIVPRTEKTDGDIFLLYQTTVVDAQGRERRKRLVTDRPVEEGVSSLGEKDWMPALALTYEPVSRMNLRASWARTIARPTFREMAPVLDIEFLGGITYVGNPELIMSHIENLDLRWEWFRRPGEVLAASVFRKDIEDPIEYVSFGVGGEERYVTAVNFPEGEVRGYELEGRTSLDVVSDRLRNFAIGGNYAWIDSAATYDPRDLITLQELGLATETRRMQGQPEYVANAHLTYDNSRLGTAIGLFYNRTGETLLAGAAVGGGEEATPDEFTETTESLDLTVSQKLKWIYEGFSLGLKAKNLTRRKRETVFRDAVGVESVGFERETPFRVSISARMEF